MDNPYHPPESELQPYAFGGDEFGLIPATDSRRWVAHTVDNLLVIAPILGLAVAVDQIGGNTLSLMLDNGTSGLFIAILSATAYGAMEGSAWQATPGKRLLGLRVVRIDGEPVTMGGAIKRNMAKYLGLSFCGFLALTVIGSNGRGWWDKFADTIVTRRIG